MINEIIIDQELKTNLINLFPSSYKSFDTINPYRHYIGYYNEKKILGLLIYDQIYDRIEIIQIEVISLYRRQHIASKIFDWLLIKARNNGTNNITLEVNKNNIPAIKLYQKYEFKIVSTRSRYYNGFDAYLMLKEM